MSIKTGGKAFGRWEELKSFTKLLVRESLARTISRSPLFVKLIDAYKPEAYTPEAFYKQLLKDALEAKPGEVIEIYSPTLTVSAVECLLPTLQKTKAKIRIHTLDPDVLGGGEQKEQCKSIQLLRENLGDKLELVLRKAMHEKAIVISNRVCYIGSINLFSAGREDPGSSYMVRYESPEIVTVLVHFLDVLEDSSK